MKIPPMLQGRLTRRLFLLFVILGLVPILVFTIIPAIYQFNASQQATASAAVELEQQAEEQLLQLAELTASRYSQVFAAEARAASLLASYAEQALQAPDQYADLADPALVVEEISTPEGWRANAADAPVGLLVSPLAPPLTGEIAERQAALSTAESIMQAAVDANPYVRSAFITTEDQMLWLYPNYLWEDGALAIQFGPDLTARPYYRETRAVVWSQPYMDIEPVISVAAPIWVDGTFQGMAGVDFALDVIVQEVLETNIREHGFVFLMTTDGDLVAMPERAEAVLLGEQPSGGAMLNRTLYDAVLPEVRAELEAADIDKKLRSGEAFVTTLNLPDGPVYFVSAPLQNVPWHAAVVLPVSDVSGVPTRLADEFRQTIENILLQSLLSGFGFMIVVLAGGLITLRRLALPIQQLSAAARSIMGGNLAYRVPVTEHDDEMADLIVSFNEMTDAVQTMRDELEQQRAELQAALARRELEFNIINDIAELTNQQRDLSDRLGQALSIARRALGSDILTVSLIDDENEITFSAYATVGLDEPDLLDLLPRCIDQKTLRHVAETQQNLRVPDVEEAGDLISEEQRECFRKLGIRMIGLRPIVSRGRALGVLTLMRHKPVVITEETITLLEALVRMLAILIENAQFQSQTRMLSTIEERRRLASELHDSVTQSLFTLSLAVEGLKAQLGDNLTKEQEEVLDLVLHQTRTVQNEMRTLIDELRPVDLDEKGLQGALRQHAQSLRRSTDIDVELTISGNLRRLPLNVQRNLNRIAQEALSNVGRHSGATRAEIELVVGENVVELTVRDNGHGFDSQAVAFSESRSLGLTSMRERAEMMGGALLVRSTPGAGTSITARIPLLKTPEEVAHG